MTQQPYPDQSYGSGNQPPMRESGDERTAAVIAHLSAPTAALVSAGWLSFIGPLVVWFIYKDKSPAVRQAAAGAFNFNVSFWVLYIVGGGDSALHRHRPADRPPPVARHLHRGGGVPHPWSDPLEPW